MKEPVKLRQKKIKNGLTSLYLDIYIDGVRTYDFLKLYLVDEKTRQDKQKNKETMQLANAIKAQRIVDIQNGRFNFKQTKDILFKDVADMCIATKGESTQKSYNIHLIMISEFFENKKIGALSGDTLDNLIIWLRGKNYKTTTIRQLKAFVSTVINYAYKKGIITNIPRFTIKVDKTNQKLKYLTIAELKRFSETMAKDKRQQICKDMFLLSCFTGMRYSDIIKLKWSDIVTENDRMKIIFKQKKTGNVEYLTLNKQAVDILEMYRTDCDFIFPQELNPSILNYSVQRLAKKAEIETHITFHSARHTFATTMLTMGADIYTVSKLLGHQNISTTQIYAKVIDEKKQAAVDLFPDIKK